MSHTDQPLTLAEATAHVRAFHDAFGIPNAEAPAGAIGDRDALKFADDGSLTLYIQRESPGSDKESNWLPAPQEGTFTMNLRLYWPKPAALDGTWQPPAVEEPAK